MRTDTDAEPGDGTDAERECEIRADAHEIIAEISALSGRLLAFAELLEHTIEEEPKHDRRRTD